VDNIHSDNGILASNCVVSMMLFLNAEKSVGSHVKKFITSSFFNRITFYLAVKCRKFQ